jgi:hypothetical protein
MRQRDLLPPQATFASSAACLRSGIRGQYADWMICARRWLASRAPTGHSGGWLAEGSDVAGLPYRDDAWFHASRCLMGDTHSTDVKNNGLGHKS